MHPIFFVICFFQYINEKRKNLVLSAQNFKYNSVPYFYFVCNLCTSTVPLSQHHNFGICDKGDPREESKRAERERPYIISKNIQKKAQAIYYYLDLLYVLKGFLDWSIAHPTFYHTKLTYQCMIISSFNFIYINIDIIPTIIVNPYTMQITLYIKVFFKS